MNLEAISLAQYSCVACGKLFISVHSSSISLPTLVDVAKVCHQVLLFGEREFFISKKLVQLTELLDINESLFRIPFSLKIYCVTCMMDEIAKSACHAYISRHSQICFVYK